MSNLKFYVMWISFERKVKLVPYKQIDSLFDTFDCRNTFDSYNCNYLRREKFNTFYSTPHAWIHPKLIKQIYNVHNSLQISNYYYVKEIHVFNKLTNTQYNNKEKKLFWSFCMDGVRKHHGWYHSPLHGNGMLGFHMTP